VNRGMKRLVTLALVIGALVAAQVAMAGSTVVNSYGSNAAKPVLQVKHVTKVQGAVASVKGKTLPFTGMDLGVLVVAGVGLLGLGLGLRRFGRDKA